VELTYPLLVMVFACTAIPSELRPLTVDSIAHAFEMRIGVDDIVANILGYVPLGALLAGRGRWSAIKLAALVSLSAEVAQLFSVGRAPSVIDIGTNVLGAAIGLVLSRSWKGRIVSIPLRRFGAGVAGALAIAYVMVGANLTPRDVESGVVTMIAAPPWLAVNTRGDSAPGRLEAHWTFDDIDGDEVHDSSGNGLRGTLVNRPVAVSGIDGRAVALNGVDQWIDLGDPASLRLTGSMTVTAWVNSSAFPIDDAAIVSNTEQIGFQLDTTVDQGSRTIAFKLSDRLGRLMARYGKTSLTTNRWYHVAGVYDAQAQTLNVYLNGRRDDGCLVGRVAAHQHISGVKAFVGRRTLRRGFEFAGLVDEVRVYSRALTQIEVGTLATAGASALARAPIEVGAAGEGKPLDACRFTGPKFDARIAGPIAAFGMLVAFACAGLLPLGTYKASGVILAFLSGFLLVPPLAVVAPHGFPWVAPVLTLAGGVSVLASTKPLKGTDESLQQS
jgi:hypothetical protein